MEEKYNKLLEILKSCGSLAVAFSGGVDSAFLLYAAKEALNDRVLALTGKAEMVPDRELSEALDFCRSRGIRQRVIGLHALDSEAFAENPPERCYICKKMIFTSFMEAAREEGFSFLAEGSNVDDEGDYRPGLKALKELGVLSPLKAAGLNKAEIRALSKRFGLPTWDKPSYACLASRFPYGERITSEKLKMVDEGEEILRSRGFGQLRVRIHGNIARIELPAGDFARFADEGLRTEIYGEFKKLGFAYTALDLLGYRSGSMNETLK